MIGWALGLGAAVIGYFVMSGESKPAVTGAAQAGTAPPMPSKPVTSAAPIVVAYDLQPKALTSPQGATTREKAQAALASIVPNYPALSTQAQAQVVSNLNAQLGTKLPANAKPEELKSALIQLGADQASKAIGGGVGNAIGGPAGQVIGEIAANYAKGVIQRNAGKWANQAKNVSKKATKKVVNNVKKLASKAKFW